MRPIDLQMRALIRHTFTRRFYLGGVEMPRDPLYQLLRKSTWKRHPAPFAKTGRGKQRRDERRFIESRKCGFGCD